VPALLLAAALTPAPATAAAAGSVAPLPGSAAESTPREREQSADEDPVDRQQEEAKREAQVLSPGGRSPEPDELGIYGSLRVRYRSESGSHGFSDGGSRVGATGRVQVLPQKWLFARAEAGFNLLDELRILANANNPDGGQGDTFFRRLLNVGYESPSLFLVFGKTWSTYYKVTGFTDRFEGTGGQAAGTYNAGTDGGYTGTGRAENALQTRVLVDVLAARLGLAPFSLNIQLQDGEPIPNIDGQRYGHAVGLSALLATREHFSLGIAYNHARVPDADDPRLRTRGIRGNAEALAVGARWFDDDWYLATVVARLRNHEATDQGNYFDGLGWELYAQRRLRGKWWATGGWNWLQPDAGQPLAGDYRVKYAVIGLRYALKDFERVLYVNVRLDQSRDQDGEPSGDVLTAGIRWNF
jgi:predicted porin